MFKELDGTEMDNLIDVSVDPTIDADTSEQAAKSGGSDCTEEPEETKPKPTPTPKPKPKHCASR